MLYLIIHIEKEKQSMLAYKVFPLKKLPWNVKDILPITNLPY